MLFMIIGSHTKLLVKVKKCSLVATIVNKKKDKIEVNSLKQDHKEFIKNNKFILKTHQRFIRSEKHKLIRLLEEQMMIKEHNQLIK